MADSINSIVNNPNSWENIDLKVLNYINASYFPFLFYNTDMT